MKKRRLNRVCALILPDVTLERQRGDRVQDSDDYRTTLRSSSVILRKSATFMLPLGTPAESFPLVFLHEGAEVSHFAGDYFGRSPLRGSGYILGAIGCAYACRSPPRTKPRSASLVPKGSRFASSLSLTRKS